MARVVMVASYGTKIENMATPLVMRTTEQIAIAAKRNINNRTGKLSRSVRARRYGRKGRVLIGTQYWHYYEYGTKPHVIRISKAKVLSSGQQFFGPAVFHPGNPAFSPLRRAVIQTRVR